MVISWTRSADSPFSRVNHQAIQLNDAFYVFGGFNSQLREVNKKYQIDVFRWNIRCNVWEELPYPLKLRAWDCSVKSWVADPLLSNDGSIQPVHRFGHTVVAWRGRGWLFGGRTHQQVCSNQLYMFDPGKYRLPNSTSAEYIEFVQPCWAEVLGTTGAAPSPRDGHAATVLENAMFIFGGFEDHLDSYDNQVYRLDFYTWSWTLIKIHDRPARLDIHESTDTVTDTSVDASEGLLTHHSPLPRDFTSLMGHRGRLFVFGGRSECSVRRGYDIYDSSLWELVPLSVRRTDNSSHFDSELVPLKPADCQFCSKEKFQQLATLDELRRMAWEEETGNWINSECWATCPARPCCLWRVFTDEFSNLRWGPTQHGSNNTGTFHLSNTPVSRWHTGKAAWRRLHSGHGLQLPDQLLPRLFGSAAVTRSSNSSGLTTVAPYGRRSLSHWAYMGHLYIGFGTVRCQTREQWQLHYEDVWRFDLADENWYPVRTTARVNHCEYHQPSARRRAVACLYVPKPRILHHTDVQPFRLEPPWIFLYGGTQPRLLNETVTDSRRSSCVNPRPFELFTSHSALLSNLNRPVTQNQILGLEDGDSVSMVSISNSCSITPLLWNTITSPIALFLVNTHPSIRTDHLKDLFYLFIVVPQNYHTTLLHSSASPSHLSPCPHPSTVHTVCVFTLNDVADMLQSPVSSSKSIGQLIFCNRYLGSEHDRLRLYQALNLAWSFLCCPAFTELEAVKSVCGNERRLQVLVIEQTVNNARPLGSRSTQSANLSPSPVHLLEHVCFVLCESAHVYQYVPGRTQQLELFTVIPGLRPLLLNTVELLVRCVGHSLKRESLLLPASDSASLVVKKATTDCSYCGIARSVYVLIDYSALSHRTSSSSKSQGDLPSSNSSINGTETAAQLLHHLLPYIRCASYLDALSGTHASFFSSTSWSNSPSISGETVPSWIPKNVPEILDLEDPIIPGPSNSEVDMSIDPAASSDSDDATPSERITIDGVGVLVKGKEKLLELPDCYIMQLDTSLYDLCLRHLRSISSNVLPLVPMLPIPTIHHLKRIHSPPSNVGLVSRQSDSG